MGKRSIPNRLPTIKEAPHPFTIQQIWFDKMIEVSVKIFYRTLKIPKQALDDPATKLMRLLTEEESEVSPLNSKQAIHFRTNRLSK